MESFHSRELDPPFGDYTDVREIGEDDSRRFRRIIYAYYGEHGRSFPWRETRDPYRILVSEIMLQQTQTDRVLPKYEQFLGVWPDFESLSRASLAEVYRVWQGLGYNRRAKALIEIARAVQEDFGGKLPEEEADLLKLPMVGETTAAGVRAFAFERPAVYLETNIRRVFIHFFFEGRVEVRDREVKRIAGATLDTGEPAQWHYALMDYGVFLKGERPGLNRRSVHYSAQAPFEGSDRQIRGAILRFLSEHPGSGPGLITGALPFEEDRVKKVLEALRSEKMVVKEDAVYSIDES